MQCVQLEQLTTRGVLMIGTSSKLIVKLHAMRPHRIRKKRKARELPEPTPHPNRFSSAYFGLFMGDSGDMWTGEAKPAGSW